MKAPHNRNKYWIAECLYAKENLDEAAAAYGELLNRFPDSTLRLDAAFRQALVFFEKGDLGQTVALLGCCLAALL